MKNSTLVCFTLGAFASLILSGSSARALIVPWKSFIYPNPKQKAEQIDKHNTYLKTPESEISFKSELIHDYITKRDKFNKLRTDADTRAAYGPLYLSWVEEVALALNGKTFPRKLVVRKEADLYNRYYRGTPVDTAKLLAKNSIVDLVLEHWDVVKMTVFNTDNLPKKKVEAYMGDRLLNTQFLIDTHGDSKFFNYDLDEVGHVQIAKNNLKSVRVALEISSHDDANSLEPGVEKLKAGPSTLETTTPPASGGLESGAGSGPSSAPAMPAPTPTGVPAAPGGQIK